MSITTSASLHRVSLPELIVIMPVYNEAEIIKQVVAEWVEMLDGLQVPYRLHLANDGSTDGTQEVLEGLSHPCLEISQARNRGHGPTILRAYRVAGSRTSWIFQTDSDGEIPASHFPEFWKSRVQGDLLIGKRVNRDASWSRRVVTASLRCVLFLFYGKGVTDGNCPYRLMRSEAFRPLFDKLPEDTFAPNVLISGYSAWKKLRIVEFPVSHQFRQTGQCSMRKGALCKAAIRSARQTLSFRFQKDLKA
ncbi:glycosyltransferase family 2 protein [Kiritimatiellota bacterium B12222]|nr:glycosyltransferase family 2 protein [Kiritimatiellota bacterium B12222]